MRATRLEKVTCLLFGGAVLLMALLFLLLPEKKFSAFEKRFLAPKPVLSAEEVFSGRLSEDMEAYMADQLPGRDFWVGLNAYWELFTGRQNGKEILRGASGRLYERPVRWDAQAVDDNLTAIRDFADVIGRTPDLMLVPSAGYVLRGDLPGLNESYADGDMIAEIYARAGGQVNCFDLLPLFEAAEDPGALYYATDHHWTSLGAYTAAAAWLQSKGRDITPAADYAVTREDGFFGTTYARSALWLHAGESIELWDSGKAFSVELSEKEGVHDGLFFRERLAEPDKYTVFLDGNHSLVRIENRSPDASGKLLVIRDSFANCLGGFLAEGYETVVLADLRYYKYPLSELVETEGFDDVLIVYSLGNFLSDANLLWLE